MVHLGPCTTLTFDLGSQLEKPAFNHKTKETT